MPSPTDVAVRRARGQILPVDTPAPEKLCKGEITDGIEQVVEAVPWREGPPDRAQ